MIDAPIATAKPRSDCPACGGGALKSLLHLPAIPVQSCILLDSVEEGAAFPRHEMRLTFCEDCGFIFNAAFDERLIDYASTTEESQHFSDTFNAFAKKLVEEILATWKLQGRKVLEIGCGKGDFLRELCLAVPCEALGIDPGFIEERLKTVDGGSLRFQREYFETAMVEMCPDLVICRHTLEHIGEVRGIVDDILPLVAGRPDAGIFFETPDVGRVLREGAFWDIYFEHCSYFTPGSHARLFRAAGFDVTALRLDYGEQYIIQHARPANGAQTAALPAEEPMHELSALAAAFPAKVAEVMTYWREFVTSRHRDGKRIAVWGGGSKCVSFLTSLGLGPEIAQVIDINPFKQNRFLPGAGIQVRAPEALAESPPDTVIVMNPVYLDEIGRSLAGMGLSPEMVAV
ncbi:class I SAM-dependent methyltransferase [Tropicimonas isoalkanivorans]|uniref:Methyltransferase domain-containing protein n=1 Tax=Tropicimonas isoalkanivorans TaxID=441112 RepID=A0A1I1QA52_9RHOB|nr:class I SAM-dependent methyltransferase [Tropicimonas isoalkanivorans]SFD18945.1 Methyltransferase domain-containing protein [Tropicimonas isoalkanivorans]